MKDILIHKLVLKAILNYLRAFVIIQSVRNPYTRLCQAYCFYFKKYSTAIKLLNNSALVSGGVKTVIAVRGFLPLFCHGVKGKINGNGRTS